jgi:thiol-disulfide isomerase/thioredoxin
LTGYKKAVSSVAIILFLLPLHAPKASETITFMDEPVQAPPLVFKDGDGNDHTLSEFRGRYVLLNIWATWCLACRHELPSLDALYGQLDHKKIVVIPVAEDQDLPSIRLFYYTHKISHLPILQDSVGRAPSAYRLKGYPTTIVIDPEGRETARVQGLLEWSPDILSRLFKIPLDPQKPSP